jgi:hypothetical protein
MRVPARNGTSPNLSKSRGDVHHHTNPADHGQFAARADIQRARANRMSLDFDVAGVQPIDMSIGILHSVCSDLTLVTASLSPRTYKTVSGGVSQILKFNANLAPVPPAHAK